MWSLVHADDDVRCGSFCGCGVELYDDCFCVEDFVFVVDCGMEVVFDVYCQIFFVVCIVVWNWV
jgi:hypothetical protein